MLPLVALRGHCNTHRSLVPRSLGPVLLYRALARSHVTLSFRIPDITRLACLQIRVVRAFQAGLERKDPSLSGPSAARLMEISRQLRQQEREGACFESVCLDVVGAGHCARTTLPSFIVSSTVVNYNSSIYGLGLSTPKIHLLLGCWTRPQTQIWIQKCFGGENPRV